MYKSNLTKHTEEFTISVLLKKIKNKEIPKFYPNEIINSWDVYKYRDDFIEYMGFALISLDWIVPLSKWIGERKCLEIMSGTGSLSYALQQQGINIKVTDNFSWNGSINWNKDKNYWTDIENIDCLKAIEKYGKDVDIIICSWAYMDDTLYRSLKLMREINPKCLMICIGESLGGCTADDNFFDNLEEVYDKDFQDAVSNYKNWIGIHDYISLVK